MQCLDHQMTSKSRSHTETTTHEEKVKDKNSSREGLQGSLLQLFLLTSREQLNRTPRFSSLYLFSPNFFPHAPFFHVDSVESMGSMPGFGNNYWSDEMLSARHSSRGGKNILLDMESEPRSRSKNAFLVLPASKVKRSTSDFDSEDIHPFLVSYYSYHILLLYHQRHKRRIPHWFPFLVHLSGKVFPSISYTSLFPFIFNPASQTIDKQWAPNCLHFNLLH